MTILGSRPAFLSRLWLLGFVFSCNSSEPEHVDPPARQSTPVESTSVAKCGHLGSMEALSFAVVNESLPELRRLDLPAQQQVVGALNVVTAPCCACEGRSNIAQCLLLAPKGCENLPALAERAIQLAASGVKGNELQMALSYGDIWVDTGSQEAPEKSVQVQLWMDPGHPLLGALWSQLTNLEGVPSHQKGVGFHLHFITTGTDSFWAQAVTAADNQGHSKELIQVLVEEKRGLDTPSDAGEASVLLERVQGRAEEVGLDLNRWSRETLSQEVIDQVAEESARAEQLGVRASPTWFINGYRHRGLQSQASIQRVIALELEELSRQEAPLDGAKGGD